MTQRGGGPARDSRPRQSRQSHQSPGGAWPRKNKVLAWVLSGLVVVVLAGVIAALAAGGRPTARPAGGPTTAADAAVVTKGSKWITGRGGKLLDAVNADVGRVSAAGRAGDRAAARAAGGQLGADARAALAGPVPPVDAAAYRSALHDLVTSGSYTASGNFRKASPLLAAGESGITKVTAAADLPDPAHAPAAVTEPNGQ
jgi:hypothetical protein